MKKKTIFKQPLFWTQLVSIVAILFLIFEVIAYSNENAKLQKTIDKDRNLSSKAFAYVRQMNVGTNFYDSLIDFTTTQDTSSSDFKEYINYSSDSASVDIAALYAKKNNSNLIATGIDTSQSDVFLVGVDVVNTSNTPATVNPKEFFLKSGDDYLKFDSTFFTGETYTDGTVLIPAGETKTFVNFYGGDKDKKYDEKELKVQYGKQFWK